MVVACCRVIRSKTRQPWRTQRTPISNFLSVAWLAATKRGSCVCIMNQSRKIQEHLNGMTVGGDCESEQTSCPFDLQSQETLVNFDLSNQPHHMNP